jgi:hypothetical protein
VVYNTLTEMVANETTKEPLLLEAIEGEDYGHVEEAEGSGSIMDEGFLDMETQCNPFERIGNWNKNWQLRRPLWKNTSCGPQEHGVTSKWQPKLGSRND